MKFPSNLIEDFSLWPLALPEKSIPRTDVDWAVRAGSAIEILIPMPVLGLRVLDFGCGNGIVSRELAMRGAKVHAYDIDPTLCRSWPDVVNIRKKELLSNKYDVVFILDVLDHAEDPCEVLMMASSVLDSGGIIVLRCHPYFSRHGGHHYFETNFAFAHLVTDINHLVGTIVHDPENSYKQWIKDAGLNIVNHQAIIDPVEPFFMRHFPEEIKFHDITIETMSQSFHDFILKK